jgi:sodium/proline symporter
MTIAFTIAYGLLLICMGLFKRRDSESTQGYLLANRSLGVFTQGFSAAAATLTGWMFLGLPGLAAHVGLSCYWILIGSIVGTYLNYKVFAFRLHAESSVLGVTTLAQLLGSRSNNYTALLIRQLAGIATAFFMVVYVWAQVVALAKVLASPIGIDITETTSILVATGLITFYTAIGGLPAVVWSDVIKGVLILSVLIALPVFLLYQLFNSGSFFHLLNSEAVGSPHLKIDNIWGANDFLGAFLLFISNWGIGFANLGQPTVAARFIATKNSSGLKKAAIINVGIKTIALFGAITIGLCSVVFLSAKPADRELTFPALIYTYLPPQIHGVLLVTVLATLIASAGAFLHIAVSTLSCDTLSLSLKTPVLRAIAALGGILAGALALFAPGTVLELAQYSWVGLSATYAVPTMYFLWVPSSRAPVILFTMFYGLLFMTAWHALGLSPKLYEAIPLLLSQLFVCFCAHKIFSSAVILRRPKIVRPTLGA